MKVIWRLSPWFLPALCFTGVFLTKYPAISQEIIPAENGTNTQINRNGNQINIEGGTQSQDGTNLFHDLEKFGVGAEETVIFNSTQEIFNILTRITGGDPSIIRGSIQVDGGSNLFLMNPAGFVLFEGANINVPGDLTLTTSTAIGFGNNLFNAFGDNDYSSLNGNPDSFIFESDAVGTIVNAANLDVPEGDLGLIAGNVVNLGNISARNNILVTVVPGTPLVRMSIPGNLLSLEIEPPRNEQGQVLPFEVLDLPSLLTGTEGSEALGLTVEDGSVREVSSGQIVSSAQGTQTNLGTITGNQLIIPELPNADIIERPNGISETSSDEDNGISSPGDTEDDVLGDNLGDGDNGVTNPDNPGDNVTDSETPGDNLGDEGNGVTNPDNPGDNVTDSETPGDNLGDEGNGVTNPDNPGDDVTDSETPGDNLGDEGNGVTNPDNPGDNVTDSETPGNNLGDEGNGVTNPENPGDDVTDSETPGDNLGDEGNGVTNPENPGDDVTDSETPGDNLGDEGNGVTNPENPGDDVIIGGNPGDEPVVDPSENPPTTPGDEPVVDPPENPPTTPGDEPVVDPPENPPTTPGDEPVVDPPENPPTTPGDEPVVDPPENPPTTPGDEPDNEPDNEPVVDPADNPLNINPVDLTQPSRSETAQIGITISSGNNANQEVPIERTFNQLENRFANEIANYYDLTKPTPVTLSEAIARLRSIEQQTGVRAALIYAYFVTSLNSSEEQLKSSLSSSYKQNFDSNSANFANECDYSEERENAPTTAQNDCELAILVVTSRGVMTPVTPGISKDKLLATVKEMEQSVRDPSEGDAYLVPAQQIYKSLVAPIEEQLKAREIDNLVFIANTDLRSLPLAAIHDGEQFLVEKYSLAMMPSLRSSDTEYKNIQDTTVLAMGAEKFANQTPLPGVPIELSLITEQIWQGSTALLNEQFTRNNFKETRGQVTTTDDESQPFGIVHLATHAEFREGKPNRSYIQWWDSRLGLDELRNFDWGAPPLDLIVLSACRTAVGSYEAKLGFSGLALQAGAKSAMGSLWYVSDVGTLALMSEFYQQLQDSDKDPNIRAEALRQAQIAMITGKTQVREGELVTTRGNIPLPEILSSQEDIDLSHPYYWSAFTMVGNPW